jgi:hypothetical protein
MAKMAKTDAKLREILTSDVQKQVDEIVEKVGLGRLTAPAIAFLHASLWNTLDIHSGGAIVDFFRRMVDKTPKICFTFVP